MLALFVAILAIFAQPIQPPAEFIARAVTASQPVNNPGFIGVEWFCWPDDEEVCYAGLDLSTGDLVTGP